MGKPYATELTQLPDTYAWAMQQPIEPLLHVIARLATLPLLAVGSGGSLSAAHLASSLHQRYSGAMAKAVTPMDAVVAPPTVKEIGTLFLSAGGGNADIISAFRRSVVQEVAQLAVVCCSPGSPLTKIAAEYRFVDLLELGVPAGKDGFLATNSLLAMSVLLCRAYTNAFAPEDGLPKTLDALCPGLLSDDLRQECLPLWERETLLVLYGPALQPAAFDLESKFTEAALGSVQIADYRNFAHGRHHWLAKRGQSTAVLALVGHEDTMVAERTISLLPKSVPTVRLSSPEMGVGGRIRALTSVLQVVGFAGEARGIDPGRPGVPSFGRRIYNMRVLGTVTPAQSDLPPREAIAIARKRGAPLNPGTRREDVDLWRRAYQAFSAKLRRARFRAIVFDYDGTLCDHRDRYCGLCSEMADGLERLLRAGILVGIATGRGRSVRSALCTRIGERFWSNVIIGYYNGAYLQPLTGAVPQEATDEPCQALAGLAVALRADPRLSSLAECSFRRTQITVEPKTPVLGVTAWDTAQQLVHAQDECHGVTVVRSGHSVDILAPGVTKKAVVREMERLLGGTTMGPVLCIGDRGRWPGNDFALLQAPYSLSVDEVSQDPQTCWNLAPPGFRGVQATLEYLRSLEVGDCSARFVLRPQSRSSDLCTKNLP